MNKKLPTFILFFNQLFFRQLSISLLFLFIFSQNVLAQQDSVTAIQDTLTKLGELELQVDSNKKIPEKTIQKKGKKIIEGTIKDFTTSEVLSFATVYFPGTGIGLKADLDGNFKFEMESFPIDSLAFSVIGYAKKTIYFNWNLPYQKLNIELERASYQMKDFVVQYEKDPALKLVKKVIKNKPINNYDKAENYSYEVYNKLELDINKIPKKAFKNSPILKKFDFVETFMDSTSEEKPFLPLFLTETISDYYFQKKPKKTKEFIKGSRISGYKNQSVSQMLGSMYQNINVYDNMIPIFNVDFVSPISNDAPFYYKYQITDTQWINNLLCYQVAFTPKRGGEHTFNGDFWIHDTDFAVQKINMIVTKEQNINWVNKVTMLQEFTSFQDTLWFLTKDKFYVDFLPPHGDKIAGFLGRKTTTYKNILVNNKENELVVNDKKNRSDSQIEDKAMDRNEDYWNTVRHDSLSINEKAIYKMIDTIQSLPVYKKYYSAFYLIGTGIKEVGPLEIGPIYNIYSKNPIEGTRLRLTLGTTPKLFKNIYLRGYMAYGLKDERTKYMASALWILNRQPRSFIYAEVKHDLENNVNQYDDARSLDNIFSSIGRKSNVPWKLAFADKYRLEYMKSFFNGFRFTLSSEYKSFTPYAPLPSTRIFTQSDGTPTNTVTHNELGLELRFAYKEQFVEGNYYRTSLGTKKPILKLYAGVGFKNILSSNYSFSKFRFTLTDYIQIPHAGYLYYNIFAGKINGTLPYPLLEIHPGNEFYYYNNHSFNMMYRYEYLSDTYIGLITEHSLGSLFFKYIPLIKKTKIRTFWNAKAVYGTLSPQNELLNFNKGFAFQSLSRSPYIEAGTGVENIFKVLRIDFVWRLLPTQTNNDSPARRFGIFGSMKFDF